MKNWRWFSVSLLVIMLDQLTKYYAMLYLIPYEPTIIFSMANFTLAYNTGAAFSFLHSAGEWHRWFFAGFSFVMSVVIAAWILRQKATSRLQLAAFSLILGGALGNLIDRVHVGYVIDFIQLHYDNYYFAIFNVADSAICLAAGLLVFDLCNSCAKKP